MTGEYSGAAARVTRRRILVEQMRAHGWTCRTWGAIFGFFGGILSSVAGSILTTVSWFTAPAWHGLFLHRAGTVLLFLTIPLLILGAHCLDLEEKKKDEG